MAKSSEATYENFARCDDVKMGSSRSFGLVFAAVFLIIGAIKWWHDSAWAIWFLIAAAGFAAAALLVPGLLAPLNRLWFRFGLLLHAVVSPVIMGLMFYVTITPIGWLMRALGKR